jgi:hypothetical protein
VDLGITFEAWIRAFVFTQVVEVPIYCFLLTGKVPLRAARGFAATLITHPILWWVLPPVWRWSYWSYVVVGESFVTLTEAVWIWATAPAADRTLAAWASRRSPLLVSLCANATSAGLGMLTRALFEFP